MFDKEKEAENYLCEIEISAKKRQEIEICAKSKGMTFDQFIKDAINQGILECKSQTNENEVLPNQLELFA
jgi:hypothetical protein